MSYLAILCLKAENVTLSNTTNKLQSDFVSHTTVCETARKNTKAQLKKLDGLDFIEYQAVNKKINDELSRVSKVCVNLQKQISNTKAQKLYV